MNNYRLALDAAKHMTNWLDMDLCDCEGAHTCGYTEVKRTRDALIAAAERQLELSKFLEKEEWNDAFAQGFNVGFNSDEKPELGAAALAEALEEVLPFIITDPTQCRGDKCRDIWCISCQGEGDACDAAVRAHQASRKAAEVLAAYRKRGDL